MMAHASLILFAASLFLALPAMVLALEEPKSAPAAPPARPVALVIHGGAGTLSRAEITPQLEERIRADLAAALRDGYAILSGGGTALDAVEAAVVVLEDSPHFNAGRGSVFTHDERNEMDASIMDGRNRAAGAVAGITVVKNPIRLARAVMESSPHVFLMGKGAEAFAALQRLELVDPGYFRTERRWDELQAELAKERDADKGGSSSKDSLGTVGAVALDRNGDLAAATSTGGMTNKKWGRVGDSPIIGAGVFADNRSCAVSSTGHGEYFIRLSAAQDVAAMMEYAGLPVEEAARRVIHEKLPAMGGDGGLIALDAQGRFSLPFNSAGMYRGWIGPDEQPHVAIWND